MPIFDNASANEANVWFALRASSIRPQSKLKSKTIEMTVFELLPIKTKKKMTLEDITRECDIPAARYTVTYIDC